MVDPQPSNPRDANTVISMILDAVNAETPGAESRLLELVYSELRRIAAAHLRKENSDPSLTPTALINEAYLRLFGAGSEGHWNSRAHFFSAAARAMRQILIDHARRKHRLKRGGNRMSIDLDVDQVLAFTNATSDELLALEEALKTLEHEDPQLVRLIELRFFNGHTIQETAEILGISVRTVNRSWQYAKARLWTMLAEKTELPAPPGNTVD